MKARVATRPERAAKPARRGANHRRKLLAKRQRRKALVSGSGWVRSVFLASACAAGIVGAGALAWRAAAAYQEGKILTVNRIEVAGNRHYDASRLSAASGLEVGARLPRLSLEKARDAILQLPGIQEVKVRRGWDGEVRIRVREEEVLALAPGRRGSWSGLALSGDWMPVKPAGAEADLPVVEGRRRPAPELARFLAAARRAYPDLYHGFSQIVASGSGTEAVIYWRDGRVKVRVDYSNKSLNSLEFLRALLGRDPGEWTPGSTVDLRVEGYAYVL